MTILLNNKKIGFTIIEILVTIMIFIAIAMISLASFRGGTSKGELKMARDQIVNDIRNLRSLALSGKELWFCMYSGGPVKFCPNGKDGGCDQGQGQTCEPYVPTGGYGLRIKKCDSPPCGYTLFADFNKNGKFEDREALADGIKTFSNNILVTEFKFFISPDNYIFDKSNDPLDIVFLPYDANVSLSSESESLANNIIYRTKITLKRSSSEETISFIINGGTGTIIEGE